MPCLFNWNSIGGRRNSSSSSTTALYFIATKIAPRIEGTVQRKYLQRKAKSLQNRGRHRLVVWMAKAKKELTATVPCWSQGSLQSTCVLAVRRGTLGCDACAKWGFYRFFQSLTWQVLKLFSPVFPPGYKYAFFSWDGKAFETAFRPHDYNHPRPNASQQKGLSGLGLRLLCR